MSPLGNLFWTRLARNYTLDSSTLSKGSRSTLVNVALSDTILFQATTTKAEEIGRLFQNFICPSYRCSSINHLLKWSILKQPTAEGGLGNPPNSSVIKFLPHARIFKFSLKRWLVKIPNLRAIA